MSNTDGRAAGHLRRAAFSALLTAPALAIPATTAPAATAPASPAAAAPACHQPGHRQAAAGPDSRPARNHRDRTEELIANLRPAPGSTVPAAATISFLIADEQPFPAPASADATITVNGTPVTATAGTAENGVPVTYASHHDTKPRPARCEIPFTFTLPAAISATAHIQVTAHDSDGGTDTARWTLTIQTTTLPTGAIGGIVVAAAAGLTLLATQARRRRPHHPAPS